MSVTDEQLEKLEAYMDGELPAEQEGELLRQLAGEPELAAAMAALRAQRDGRNAVWHSFEPDDAAVQRVMMRIESAIDRHNVWAHRLARWRIPSAAAACILLGFLFGWVGRSTTPQDSNAVGGAMLVSQAPQPSAQGGTVQPNLPNPNLTTVNNQITRTAPAAAAPVKLPIVDEYGRQVGVQEFRSVEEATRFVDDLNRWQHAQEKVINGNVTLTGVQKF
jgi:anti-sigma factor RsiW